MPSFPETIDNVSRNLIMVDEMSTPLRHVLRLHSRRLQIFQVAAGPQRREPPSSTRSTLEVIYIQLDGPDLQGGAGCV